MADFFKARWMRFSMRSLVLLTTVCCLLLGGWSFYAEDYRQQMRAIVEVNDRSGAVTVEPSTGNRWHRWLMTTMLGEDAFVEVKKVQLSRQALDEETVAILADFPFMHTLVLDRTQLSPAAIRNLQRLTQVESLSLRYTNVDDSALEYLTDFGSLRELYLTSTPVTDVAIDRLVKLKNLRQLFIRWTKISEDGAERLRKALPGCKVHHYNPAAGE